MWQVEIQGVIAVVCVVPAPVANVRVPEHLWSGLEQLIADRPEGYWLVDVSTERMLTSEALAMIVGIVRRVHLAGGRIAFAGCSSGVTNVLTSMRLAKMLPMFADVSTGVTALANATFSFPAR